MAKIGVNDVIGVSLSEPHTSVVNSEFLCMYVCMYHRGAGGSTYVHLVLRFPTSRSHATSQDTRTQDFYVSFSVCY